MSEDKQQNQESSGSDQIPERIEPVFQADHVIERSLNSDLYQKVEIRPSDE